MQPAFIEIDFLYVNFSLSLAQVFMLRVSWPCAIQQLEVRWFAAQHSCSGALTFWVSCPHGFFRFKRHQCTYTIHSVTNYKKLQYRVVFIEYNVDYK